MNAKKPNNDKMNATKAYVTAKIEELLQEQILEGMAMAGNPSFKVPDLNHDPNFRYIILIILRIGLEMVPNI